MVGGIIRAIAIALTATHQATMAIRACWVIPKIIVYLLDRRRLCTRNEHAVIAN